MINAGALPTLSSTLNPAAICNGTVFTYLPTSTSPNVGYSWAMQATPGISSTMTTGGGAINTTLINTTGAPITVPFTYTLTSGAETNTEIVNVVVNPAPKSSFTVNSNAECLTGNSFAFTNTSAPGSGPVTYTWVFGDGAKSGLTNPSHTYTTPGTFKATLLAVSSQGCVGEFAENILVNEEPVADFTYSIQSPYNTNAYQFTNTSADAASTITASSWNFGDGSPTSAVTSPPHTYAASGTYSVALTATNAKGCSATVTENVATPILSPEGAADFLIGSSAGANNTAGQCLGSTFFFTDNSVPVPPATVASVNWTFGDGGTATNVPTATHTYTSTGTFTVTETVQFTAGNKVQVTQSVNVYPKPASMTLLPSTPQILCAGVSTQPVYFQPSQDGLQFSWVITNPAVGLGNGTGNNFPSFTATNTTNAPLSADVQVSTVSPYGCAIPGQKFTITVDPLPDITGPLPPQTGCSGTQITMPPFTGSIPGTTYSWTNTNPVTGLAATGTGNIAPFTGTNYTAGPIISYITVVPVSNGCRGTGQVTSYTVEATPLLSSPQNGLSICSGATFTYTPTAIAAGTVFNWSRAAVAGIVEPATTGTNGINEVLTNQTPNPITVAYQYTMQAGSCPNTQTVSVVVQPTPVLSGSLTPPALCSGSPFIYAATSATAGATFAWSRAAVAGISNAAATGTGDINETLTDNSNAASVPVVYQYVITIGGCTNTQEVDLMINPIPTIALPVPSAQNVCSGAGTIPVHFTVNPAGTTVNWTNTNPAIGLAATGTGDILSFSATNTGATPLTADIQGTAQTAAGCNSPPSTDYVYTVNPAPAAAIDTPSGTLLCLGNSIPLAGSGGDTYQWTLAGNPIAGAVGATLAATAPGAYGLIAFNTQACSDTAQVAIAYIPKPIAGFTYSKSCLDTPIVFNNTSTETGGIPVTYSWSDNDDHSSVAASPTFVYGVSGTWSVSLVVTPEGCATLADTAVQSIDITRPLPGISLPADFIESGVATPVNARTFEGAAYLWNPATGLSSSVVSDPLATLTAAQEYNIIMTFISGCVTTDTLTVNVIPMDVIYIPNAFTPNGDGKNDLFVIAGITSYPGSSLAIYDRWGKQVYFASSYQNNWNGGNLQAGTYIYVLQLKIPDGPTRLKKGFVEIIR